MSGAKILFLTILLTLFVCPFLLMVSYARRIQGWQVPTLKQLHYSDFIIGFAAGRVFLWHIRLLGMSGMALAAFVIYLLLTGNPVPRVMP